MKKVINVDGSTYKELGQFKEFDLVAVVNQDGDLKLGYLETQAGDKVTIYSKEGGVVEYTIDCINLVNQAQTEWYKKFLEKQELKFNADKRRFESTKGLIFKESGICRQRKPYTREYFVELGKSNQNLHCISIEDKDVAFPKIEGKSECIVEDGIQRVYYFKSNADIKTEIIDCCRAVLFYDDDLSIKCPPTEGYKFINGSSFSDVPIYTKEEVDFLVSELKKSKKKKLEFGRINLKFGVETFIGGDRCVSNCDTVVYLGQRSDGLCCLDIDCKGILFPKLATCIEETPNGYHIYFRHNGAKTNLRISPTCTLYRGDNRYMICSPTNGYSFIKGSFDNIPTYNDQELEELINIFKKQNYGI